MSDRRSGSTLLENILSKSPETVSVGELAMLKGHILKEGPGDKWNWTCSCNRAVEECEFWSPILRNTYNSNPNDFDTNIKWAFKSGKTLGIALFPTLFRTLLRKISTTRKNKKIVRSICKVYRQIFGLSGKRIIIDSSKDPVQALAVYYNEENIDVKVIWLKRDLRAIATSKNKWKSINKKKQKSLLSRLNDVFYYRRICKAVSKLIPPDDFIEIEYENLAQRTQQELERIINKFNMQKYQAPQFMELENDHTVGGTPERFTKKPIVYDTSWKELYKNKKVLYFTGSILNKM
jgi:hypothetical protein